MPEWSNGLDLGSSVLSAYLGSNPSSRISYIVLNGKILVKVIRTIMASSSFNIHELYGLALHLKQKFFSNNEMGEVGYAG